MRAGPLPMVVGVIANRTSSARACSTECRALGWVNDDTAGRAMVLPAGIGRRSEAGQNGMRGEEKQRKKKAAWDLVHSPRAAAYTVFASRMRHHATAAGGKLPRQPVNTASCRVTKRQNVFSSFVNATSCSVARRQVLSSYTGPMLSSKNKGGDLRTTTKAVDCRSHRSPPPKLLVISKTCSTALQDV